MAGANDLGFNDANAGCTPVVLHAGSVRMRPAERFRLSVRLRSKRAQVMWMAIIRRQRQRVIRKACRDDLVACGTAALHGLAAQTPGGEVSDSKC